MNVSSTETETKPGEPSAPAVASEAVSRAASPIGRLLGLFRGSTDDTRVQFFRYGFVGGIAFGVDFGLLALLTEAFGMHYLLSAALAFLGGLTTNYAISTFWVFSKRTLDNRWLEFLVFGGVGVVGLGLNELILWICTDGLGAHYLLSKIVATAIVYFWNFFARKYTLFR